MGVGLMVLENSFVLLGGWLLVFLGKILKSVHKSLGEKAPNQTNAGNEPDENLLTVTSGLSTGF